MLTNKAYKHDYYNNKEDKMLNPKDVDFFEMGVGTEYH